MLNTAKDNENEKNKDNNLSDIQFNEVFFNT